MYLSLDVGTTVVKAVLFSPDGNELQVAEQMCPTTQTAQGAAEQDPAALAQAMWHVLREIFHTPQADQIEAICISTQGGSFLPVDRNGIPTHHLITWMDQRAKPIVEQWSRDGTDVWIRECSGWWPEEGLPLATITWFRNNCPREFERTAYFCSVNDYLMFLLTGEFVTNPSCAGEMLLMDPITHCWHPEMLGLAGIGQEQCSRIAPADTVAGTLSPQAQQQLGTSRPLPVYNGGQDHTLEALAVGMTRPGQALLACGTAWVINAAAGLDECRQAPRGLGMNPHILAERWVLSQYLGCFGAVNEWWSQTMWQAPDHAISRNDLYEYINRRLCGRKGPSESLFYLPYSGGRQLGLSRQAGVFWGGALDQNREDWTWAVLEGILFEVRWVVEALRQAGTPICQLWMIGGATRSSVWPQMAADILGIPIATTQYSHGPALGAAMIAGVGCGHFSDYDSCRSAFSIQKHLYEPDSRRHQAYEEKYGRFVVLSSEAAKVSFR